MNPFTSSKPRALAGRAVLFAAILSTAAALNATETTWPNWRGPNANGSTKAGEYPVRLNSDHALWKVPLPGKGSSTPIVWNERIYVTAPMDGQDALLAFDLAGKQQWATKLGPEVPPKHRQLGSSCNASPVTDGERLYVYFKSGTFAAVEFDGAIRWQTNLVQTFGREQLFWDTGSSPTVTSKDVVLPRMHAGDSWLGGFDKATGQQRWREARDYNVPAENDNGYTTPVLFEHDGRKALLIWGADHLTAHEAANGKLIWSCGGFNPKETGLWPAIATPVIAGDLAIVAVGRDDRGQGSIHAIRLGGTGDVTKTHRAWKREDVGVFVCSPTEYNGRIYLLRHRGEVVCLDPKDGRTVWSEALPKAKGSYYASPVIANGALYAAREDGTVFVGRVGDKFELVGEYPMEERIIASPVPAANRLLLRGDRHLFCFGSK